MNIYLHHIHPIPLSVCWFEVDEDIIIISSTEPDRSAMDQSGRLVPEHLSRLQHQSVGVTFVVLDIERPRVAVLANVQDGARRNIFHI